MGTQTAKSAADHSGHAPRKWAIIRDALECATGIYVRRWGIETPWFSVRLHQWLGDDDPRAHHNHPWPFWTLILKGRYLDVTYADERHLMDHRSCEVMRPGTVRYRPATHLHTVRLETDTCWSLVVTGPIVRRWQFHDGRRFWRTDKWFKERPRFPCS